jgi:uncharacterized coiled-coil DUF342 family protein
MSERKKPRKELTESTNMHLERVLGDIVKRAKEPSQGDDLERLAKAVEEIDIFLRGTKYSKKDGLVYQVEGLEEEFNTHKEEILNVIAEIRELIKKINDRVLGPEDLKTYVKGLIGEVIKELVNGRMKWWGAFFATILTVLEVLDKIVFK